MTERSVNKIKTINDPVYGFITIPCEPVFDAMEHPWFQRLRRIRQLGLTHYVYPSAHHTRFQHALGAMHLMVQAIRTLRSKGVDISPAEAEGAWLAILLHDIGHGPFSHTLERSIIPGMTHEDLSRLFIETLNLQTGGRFDMALQIFTGTYPRRFLHQLVSGQLDMDRLDYLSRDSFFTGVAEGTINTDRIIHVLNVCDDQLAVEAKGIYSVEKFLVARRLMYWQVYLHKTVIAADQMLINILCRAKALGEAGIPLFATPALEHFLVNKITTTPDPGNTGWLERFAMLDDYDIVASIKAWMNHADPILSLLSGRLINRQLFRVEMQSEPFQQYYLETLRKQILQRFKIQSEDLSYFLQEGMVSNDAYDPLSGPIFIKTGERTLTDIHDLSGQLNIGGLSTSVNRYFIAYPKEINISATAG